MWWVSVMLLIIIIAVILRASAKENLHEVPCNTLINTDSAYKLLDIRDALDFEAGHVPGSVNISLGRLPYVANVNLSTDHSIIIVGKKDRKSKKAARILKKKGFHHIYICIKPTTICYNDQNMCV